MSANVPLMRVKDLRQGFGSRYQTSRSTLQVSDRNISRLQDAAVVLISPLGARCSGRQTAAETAKHFNSDCNVFEVSSIFEFEDLSNIGILGQIYFGLHAHTEQFVFPG